MIRVEHRTSRNGAQSCLRGAIVSLALVVSGCTLLPDREFAQIGQSLKLRIEKAKRTESGKSIEFVFTIANEGRNAVNACLGPSRSVSYTTSTAGGGSAGGVSFMSVDHPGCMKEFTMPPGRDMSWSEVIDVPHISESRVDVEVVVEVVNPRRCGGWGCRSARLTSDKQLLQ